VIAKPHAFRAFCDRWLTRRRASPVAQGDGILTRKGRGVAAHPAEKNQLSIVARRAFAQEFGLTPSSRTRVHTVALGANTPQE
jgi:phage terminase small subunit